MVQMLVKKSLNDIMNNKFPLFENWSANKSAYDGRTHYE